MGSNAGALTGGDAVPETPESKTTEGQAAQAKTANNPSPAAADHSQWKPKVNPWLIAATVALAAFMEVLDTSIANVALPHISGSLGASTDEGTWVLTSYLVSNAIVLPLGGWASNLLGRKRFFLICITIFTVASFLCGIAPSLPILLLCRVLQGAGGGGLQPMAQAIMADSFEENQRGLAFSLYGLVAVLAPSIGPTLGGWITDSYSWRWIFYINIPVGLLAYILVTRLVEDPPWIKADKSLLKKVDYLGLAFLTLAMGGLQVALDKGEENDWFASNFIRFFAALFLINIVALVVWEWRQKTPLMNLKLFKFKNFAICCFLMMLVGGVLNASTVLQPQLLQQLLGYTATNAGKALTAGGLALVFVMPFAGWTTSKFPARNLAAIGFTFFAISFWLTTKVLSLDMTFAQSSWLRVLQVAPIPFCFISITNAAYVGMPREQSNQVSGLINFVRNIGGSVFIALTGAEVTNRAMVHEARLQESMSNLYPAFQSMVNSTGQFLGRTFGSPNAPELSRGNIYQQLIAQATMLGYIDVFKMLFWMAIGMVFLAFMLNKNRPGQGGGGAAMH